MVIKEVVAAGMMMMGVREPARATCVEVIYKCVISMKRNYRCFPNQKLVCVKFSLFRPKEHFKLAAIFKLFHYQLASINL